MTPTGSDVIGIPLGLSSIWQTIPAVSVVSFLHGIRIIEQFINNDFLIFNSIFEQTFLLTFSGEFVDCP